MALPKQNLPINFAKGVDQKSDPWQVGPDRFFSLTNSVFNKEGRLTKRNGFGLLSSISDESVTTIKTFQGNLTAIGDSFYAYSDDSNGFINKGAFKPLSLSTLSLVKNSLPQIQCDSATAENGMVCVVYTEDNNGTKSYKYSVLDGTTGQVLIAPADITPTGGTVTGSPRVFVLGFYFVIVFTATITAADRLQYVAISYNSLEVGAAVNISSTYTDATTVNFDGYVTNNKLYLAWNSSSSAGILMTYLTNTLSLATPTNKDNAHVATIMSVTSDGTYVFATYYDLATTSGYVLAVDQNLNTVTAANQWISSGTILNVATAAQEGACTIYYETSNAYSYDAAIPSNFVSYKVLNDEGVISNATLLKRSVGLASKAFIVDETQYVLTTYQSPYQNSYFLIDKTGNIASQLAYQKGGGYLTLGLPSVSVIDNVASIAYRIRNFIASTSTGTTNVNQTANLYFQTGISQANFEIGGVSVQTAELGSTLNATGGFLWSYDGSLAFENGFFLYPDSIELNAATSGGNLIDQTYFYQVTYEWTDNQGNRYRSAPSLPISAAVSGGGGNGSITVDIPTLRLSYKSNVTICIYRWSTAQQGYYQTTSITLPTMNDPTVDSIQFTDTNADSVILGNTLLYTTGGVIEDTATPALTSITNFDNRIWGVSGEDGNTLYYSKQVIPSVPVEMSDLLTYYVSPTQAAQGPTGPIKAIAPMDDKLIIFKKDAIYYINGTGPDNTGANSQYSQPIFVTSTVGCDNPDSIVFIPNGLMFQSDKGIWLLGRGLETSYIGAPVEDSSLEAEVNSAANIPATNEVRFTMSSGITLMYDYYFQQWGTFRGAPAVSSTIYEGLHTILSPYFKVQQETPGTYLDVNNPVLISFTTAWFNMAGLQGYERAYYFYLLGQYITPHKLSVSVAFDYSSGPLQTSLIEPNNFAGVYGGPDPNPGDGTDYSSPYGQDLSYGGGLYADEHARTNVEQWRIFLAKQKCQSFQVTVQEIYDPTFGVAAGEGLTLSGLNVVFAAKKGYRPIAAANSIGGGSNS